MNRYIIKTAGILMILTSLAFGQWRSSFSIESAYNTNPFRLPQASESWLTNPSFGLQHDWEMMAFSYQGSFLSFDNIPERNYYWHQISLFGESKSWDWGLYLDSKFNGTDYEYLDYSAFNGYLNYTFDFSTVNFVFANQFIYSDYSELTELNNVYFSSGIKAIKSFETRTTFLGGVILNFKKYAETYSYIDTQTGMGGRGRSGGYYTAYDSPAISQVQYWVRLAQSLFSSTGLAVQYSAQQKLAGENRFSSDLESYYDESWLFDDPMGYNSSAIGTELTQLFPFGFIVKSAYYYRSKDYISQGIYLDEENYSEDFLREDTNRNAWVKVQKPFNLGLWNNSTLTMELNYQWNKNESNSYWYNYDYQIYSAGFSIDF